MRITQLVVFAICLLTASLAARQQERVQTSAPPEIRALVDAVSSAVLGSSAQWEAMAKEHFAPEYLKKQTAADRKKLYDKLHAEFTGTKRGPVRREGPNAPLQVQMVGSSGPVGTIVLSLSDGMPPRITDITSEKESRD